jgi:hypothetical protein
MAAQRQHALTPAALQLLADEIAPGQAYRPRWTSSYQGLQHAAQRSAVDLN